MTTAHLVVCNLDLSTVTVQRLPQGECLLDQKETLT